MTDPTGLSFLSYRRKRLDDARLLIQLQHELGIPTWQDLSDLGQGHTDEQLRAVLADPSTANAVAYLTPDVKESATITRTELPQIVKRTEAKDGFFLVPVAAGKLGYSDIASTVGTYIGAHDLSQWNVTKVDSDPLDAGDAVAVADRVLRARLGAVHADRPTGAPLALGFHTRGAAAFSTGTALSLNWTHAFTDRLASDAVWQDRLLPALARVADALCRHAPGRPLEISGFAGLPAAVALGTAFLATRGIQASWLQYSPTRPTQNWSLSVQREESGFAYEHRPMDTSADDIAVLISIASNVEPAFAASRPDLPGFRAIIHVRRPGSYPQDVASPGQAADIATLVVQALRNVRDTYQARGTVHLFTSIPVGLAFLIGQSLNTAGPVQTYEHLQSDAVGRYAKSVLLQPSP